MSEFHQFLVLLMCGLLALALLDRGEEDES